MNSMKIISLTLRNNVRLLSKGTYELCYRPQEKIQLILGNNGCGKSTLFNELSPLPAVAGDYLSGGLKHLILEHNDSTYELISDFSKGSKHTFIKDGKVLVDEGNQTVQRRFVEQEFGYTLDLHKLILGKVKITDLPAQKRKEFFMQICPSDMTFVTDLYKRVIKSHRDAQGALAYSGEKLKDYLSKVVSDAEIKELSNIIEQKNTQIRQHQSQREQDVIWSETIAEESKALSSALLNKSRQLIDSVTPGEIGPNDKITLTDNHTRTNGVYTSVKATLNATKSELDSIESVLSNDALSDLSEDALKNQLEGNRQEIADILRQCKYPIQQSPENVLATLNEIRDDLITLFNAIEENPDQKIYHRIAYEQLNDAIAQNRRQHNQLLLDLGQEESKISTLEIHKEKVQCPQCSHTWSPVSDQEALNISKAQVKLINESVVKIENKYAKLTGQLEAFNDWKRLYTQYQGYVNQYPQLSFFWQTCTKNGTLFNAPKTLSYLIDDTIAELKQQTKMKELQRDVIQIESALGLSDNIEDLSGGGRQKILNRKRELLDVLEKLNEQLTTSQYDLNHAKAQLTRFDEIQSLLTEVETLRQDLESNYLEYMRYKRNELLDEEINELMSSVSTLNQRLSTNLSYVSLCQEYKDTTEKLKKDIEAYQLLDKLLSPTTGLIGDSLGGFINIFVEQMNDVIAKIWTTPLEILSCITGDGDVSYRFPLRAYREDFDGKDISEASDGELEVINYAFTIVASMYLNLKDWPVYMDEVGRHFSETHRGQLYSYAKLMVEMNRTDQVFVISHFPSTHGSLTTADVNVIDPTGVMITPDVNQHMEIKTCH